MSYIRSTRLHAFLLAAILGVAIGSWATSTHATEVAKVPLALLNEARTGQASVGTSYITQCRETAIYIVWGAGTSAGGVTIESSYDAGFVGTWAPLIVVPWVAASTQDIVQITGIHMNLRTRISTTITGGTIKTGITCN